MKIIITGKEGYIAQSLLRFYPEKEELILTSNLDPGNSIYLDFACPEQFDYHILEENDYVLVLAGISSPDECHNNYENVYKINVTGTKYFIEKCLERASRVLFFSSDVIYGNNDKIAYNEESYCNPFGKYAEMKFEVEESFRKMKNFKVFRMSYIFSREDKYTKYLYSCMNKNIIADVFHPFSRNVVYIKDLIKAIYEIGKKWYTFKSNVVNICGPKLVSRKDMALFFNNVHNQKLKYRLVDPGEIFFKTRPKALQVSSLYLDELLERPLTPIDAAMEKEFSINPEGES